MTVSRLATVLGLTAVTAFVSAAQSPSGRWTATQPGTTVTFDLSIAGAVVTGTMTVTKQDGGSASGALEQGTVNGGTLSFKVRMGDQTAAFVGELRGEELHVRSADKPEAPPLVLRRENALPSPSANKVTTPAGWRSAARSASLIDDGKRKVLSVAAGPGEGVVWHEEQPELQDGTIEVELRGRDVVGQSFVGVAFRGVDDRTYDAVYFRPFNFATTDLERRRRAVQYHSSPDNPWAKLRAEHPNKYESPIAPVPDPNDWFRIKIVLDGRSLSVFVNDGATPTLAVTTLAVPRPGKVGVWVGNGSAGEFANLKVTPAR